MEYNKLIANMPNKPTQDIPFTQSRKEKKTLNIYFCFNQNSTMITLSK